jgi:hypothetical protein
MINLRQILLLLLLVLIVSLVPAPHVLAQQPVEELDSIQISFWPDFDDPSVLVLISGQLPESTSFPAEVSIPVPDNARVNAVATVEDTGMLSVDFDEVDGHVSFVTSSPRFRVEYYAPYQQDGLNRSFDFQWLADLSVAEFAAEVQQPVNATTLTTEPATTNMITSQTDGLLYHALDPRAVPAGTLYQLSFNYAMASDTLTAGPPPSSSPQTTGQNIVASTETGDNNWLLYAGIAGLVALAVIGTWLIATRTSSKKSSRPAKPKPKTTTSSKKNTAVFCHNCGQAAENTDRFCRRCGAELKQP